MIKIYQVDAFTSELFKGNPAAVCPLDKWLPDETLQNIAAENNLSETAFIVKNEDGFKLRWFTPTTEVDLCGHATLAAAHIVFTELGYEDSAVLFETKDELLLTVTKIEVGYKMDFPADEAKALAGNAIVNKVLGVTPQEVFRGKDDYMVILKNQIEIENLELKIEYLSQLKARGLIVTAKGRDVDFVSRCFYPGVGVIEDPVTGSAHTLMAPFWAKRLEKDTLSARQLSARGGKLVCGVEGKRVFLYGQAVTYMKGEIVVK